MIVQFQNLPPGKVSVIEGSSAFATENNDLLKAGCVASMVLGNVMGQAVVVAMGADEFRDFADKVKTLRRDLDKKK